jgi:mRNA interferase HigB
MRIIARSTLNKFVASLNGHKDQPAVEGALDAWFHEAKKASWRNFGDVRQSHARADMVSADRVVFNIKDNSYPLVVAIDFEKSIVWIKWIGTHQEYDKINVKTVKYAD